MASRIIINSISEVPNRDQLTHEDLRTHFGTGQAIHISGTGRDKKYGYRNGIQTNVGDIRIDVWCQLVRDLIVRSGEEQLYQNLVEWEKEHNFCFRKKEDMEEHTLTLYASRIFDCTQWVDYEAFSIRYGYHPECASAN